MEINEILLFFSIKYCGDWKKIYNAIVKKEKVEEDKARELIKNNKFEYITIMSNNYPEFLRKTLCPPFVLFYKGNIDLINSEKIATIIGSRKPTVYGLNCTKKIVEGLASYKYTICSGLAKGVDACAHQSALASNIATIAIVANGLDIFYPHQNAQLYEDIVNQGGVILSEYPNGVEPTPDKFNSRNRILAALGSPIIVTEAFQKSGTLLTVRHASYIGKDIYVFPTNSDNQHVNNTLLKDGAILIESVDDIMGL